MPRVITGFLLSIGLCLLLFSLCMPYFTDQQKANSLWQNSANISKDEYYKQEARLRTNKVTLMDIGTGLVVFSATILLFLKKQKAYNWSDIRRLRSASSPEIFLFANVACLLYIIGTIWYYSFRDLRHDYPPMADTIAIPMSSQIVVSIIMIVPINAFLLFATLKSNLPSSIFVKVARPNIASILWEVLFSFLLLLNFLLLLAFVLDGDHFSIVVALVFTYVLLSLRAGQISRYNAEIVNPQIAKDNSAIL